MNVLAVGAHFDDLELGCGGSLIKHVDNGDRVIMLVASRSAYNDPDGKVIRSAETARTEGGNSARLIGAELLCLGYDTFSVPCDEELTRSLMSHISRNNIDIIYSHWAYDIHRDHQNLARATQMAGRHVQRYLVYRSNFYDSEQPFRGTYYSEITGQMAKKQEAIRCHASELERVNHSWLHFIVKQNENDGRKIGVDFAERFDIIRYLA